MKSKKSFVAMVLGYLICTSAAIWAAEITVDNFTQTTLLGTAQTIQPDPPGPLKVTVTDDDGGAGVIGRYRDVEYGNWVGSTGQGTVQVSTANQWISFGQNVGYAPALITYNGDGSGLGGGSGVDLTNNCVLQILVYSVDWPGLQLSVRVSDGTNSYTTPVQTLPGFVRNTPYNFDISPAGRSLLLKVKTIQVIISSVSDQDWRFRLMKLLEVPIRIDLTSFAASLIDEKEIRINWRTETESNLAGYNLYRSLDREGEYEKINETLIAARGSEQMGSSYEFLDKPLTPGVYWYKLEDVSLNGNGSLHGPISVAFAAGVGESVAPQSYGLEQNYPNPFNPVTNIVYRLPVSEEASLVIYDLHGKAVRTLLLGLQNAGEYVVQWDGLDDAGSQAASGIYLCTFRAGSFIAHRKMTLLR